MGAALKPLTLLLIAAFVVSSFLMVESAFAQSPPQPSVPEFSAKFVNASYTITDPYTGQPQLVNNNSIQLTIQNQAFSYPNYQLFFNVRVKPHYATFEENWTTVCPPLYNHMSAYLGNGKFSYEDHLAKGSINQSTSSVTIVAFTVSTTDSFSAPSIDVERYFSSDNGEVYRSFMSSIPYGAQLDFQVQAVVGHNSHRLELDHMLYPSVPITGQLIPAIAYDTASNWSSTQTVTIFESSNPTNEPAPTHTAPEISIILLSLLATMSLIITAVLRKKRLGTPYHNNMSMCGQTFLVILI